MLKIEKDDEDEKYSVVQLMEGRHGRLFAESSTITNYQVKMAPLYQVTNLMGFPRH
jgi:hypothetical protein